MQHQRSAEVFLQAWEHGDRHKMREGVNWLIPSRLSNTQHWQVRSQIECQYHFLRRHFGKFRRPPEQSGSLLVRASTWCLGLENRAVEQVTVHRTPFRPLVSFMLI